MGASGHLQFGVEEEFLLTDPDTGRSASIAHTVMDFVPEPARSVIKHEVFATMIETNTPICTSTDEAADHLLTTRRVVASAAKRAGVAAIAVGAPVNGCREKPTLIADQRYERISKEFGELLNWQNVCGIHVHVGIDEPELVIEACNRVRPWLPVLQSLTVNSPFSNGEDTGHASWRSSLRTMWPTATPAPWLESVMDYEKIADDLASAGAITDRHQINWHARPSDTYPTLELRVGDTCATVREAVVIAAMCRALVATVLADTRAGTPAPRPESASLGLAHWTAGRWGAEGMIFDAVHQRVRPGWESVENLLSVLSPSLSAAGDLDLVESGLSWLRRHGTGAARQREAFARDGIAAVTRQLITQTVASPVPD